MNKKNKKEAGQCWYVGIDVSARELVVAIGDQESTTVRRWANSAAAHQQLVSELRRSGAEVTVCMEASGTYSLDLALALSGAGKGIRLSMPNPRQVRRFAESLGQRNKTDPVDARVLAQYAQRMPLTIWQPPSAAALRLRAISRTIAALTRMATQHKNRQHALSASAALPALLVRELGRQVRYAEQRIARLRREALRQIAGDAALEPRWQYLLSVPGLGEVSALAVLAEVAVLPATLDARQWVAHCGLDPQHRQSGSSIHSPAHISKAGNRYLRAALYMPALVAVQHNAALRAFYERLLAHGKCKMQALTAVMRKLVHAVWGMFRHSQAFDGAKLCPQL